MIFTENFRVALRALTANKLRSALTMLGIIIGVGAVVALMAIGNGATSSITSQIESAGSNLVMVIPMRQFGRQGQARMTKLYYDDYQALLNAIQQGADALKQLPRMDMEGGVAIPQTRDFGRTW